MKRILLTCFMLMAMVVSTSAWAQDRTVTGRVTGADDGLPLPQVTVLLKGTTTGTPTDADGNYRLAVPQSGGILVFRYLGYITQEIDIQSQSIINVQLAPDAQSLGEVVVTGYGVEKKRDITGAISQVRADEIENLPMQSFDRAVQGRIAGVQVQASSGQPGGGLSFLIRGQSSIGNNQPLYIVDGIQINSGAVAGQASNNALAGLNPEDIATIEVLKDAASAAIYGAQSANGVVIITTKRGEKNSTNLSVSFQGGFTEPIGLYDMMNAQQLAEIKEVAYVNAGLTAAAAHARFGNPNDPSTLNNYDWADVMFETGSLYSANARLSGGDDKTQFYLSVGSELQESFIIASDWERQSLRVNVSHQATDKLSVTANLGVSRQSQFGSIANGNFVNGPFQAAFTSQPNSPAVDPETGAFNPYPTLAPGSHLFGYNIYQGVLEERRENFVGQVQASLSMQYKISPAFTINVLGGVDWAQSSSYNERPATIPVFAATGGQRFEDHRTNINWNTSATLNFNKSFGDHNVSAILGAEAFRSNADRHTITARGFSNQALRLLSQAASYFGSPVGTSTYFTRAGTFLRGSYNYQSKYYLNATIRRDGSSKFGDQNRVGTFYSIGASWRPIEEDFMSSQNLFNDLKLRVSYGVLGNSNSIGNFQSVTAFQTQAQYLGVNGQSLILADNEVSWEESRQANIGIDFAILENRISGSVDFFRNDTENQLFFTPLPIESSFTGITRNAGTVRSEGVELEIQSTNIDAGDFRWTSNFNITFQNNEVIELPGGVETLGPGNLTVGQPIAFNWGVNYAGINPRNGVEMYYLEDGSLSYGNLGVADGYVTGSPIADYYGGLTNSFTYKNLTLDVFIQFQGGNEVRNGDLFNLDEFGNNQNNQRVRNLDYWRAEGDVTTIGRPIQGGVHRGFGAEFPGINGTRQFSDATYARIKNIGLTYNLPSDFVSRIGLSNVSVFVQAINLVTWTKFDGIDPEVTARNNDIGGSNFAVFPVGKQYTGGISINF